MTESREERDGERRERRQSEEDEERLREEGIVARTSSRNPGAGTTRARRKRKEGPPGAGAPLVSTPREHRAPGGRVGVRDAGGHLGREGERS